MKGAIAEIIIRVLATVIAVFFIMAIWKVHAHFTNKPQVTTQGGCGCGGRCGGNHE